MKENKERNAEQEDDLEEEYTDAHEQIQNLNLTKNDTELLEQLTKKEDNEPSTVLVKQKTREGALPTTPAEVLEYIEELENREPKKER